MREPRWNAVVRAPNGEIAGNLPLLPKAKICPFIKFNFLYEKTASAVKDGAAKGSCFTPWFVLWKMPLILEWSFHVCKLSCQRWKQLKNCLSPAVFLFGTVFCQHFTSCLHLGTKMQQRLQTKGSNCHKILAFLALSHCERAVTTCSKGFKKK